MSTVECWFLGYYTGVSTGIRKAMESKLLKDGDKFGNKQGE